MKAKYIRVANSFATLPDTQLNAFAILVLACLKNNALFPTLPVTLAALQILETAFSNAYTAAQQGGPVQTAAKNEARSVLVAALRQIASYVQSLNLPNESQVLSSGFDIVNVNTSQSPLELPVIKELSNAESTRLLVSLQALRNAKAYLVQYRIAEGPWLEAGIFANTRNIVIENLTPGTLVTVRVKGIGGSTGYSEWSAPLTKMAT
jgi:hypothetical protein